MQQGHHNKDHLIKKPFYSLNSISLQLAFSLCHTAREKSHEK